MTAPPSAPQWFTSQSGTTTIPPGFTPALQHPSFHQQQQTGFGPTQFVQPMALGPQSHTPNRQWMTGPANTQAATMFAPQGHAMQGTLRCSSSHAIGGHTTPASHHGHLIQPNAPQRSNHHNHNPQPLRLHQPHTFRLRPLFLTLHPPMHTFHNNNNINHHRHNNRQHRRISHSPTP